MLTRGHRHNRAIVVINYWKTTLSDVDLKLAHVCMTIHLQSFQCTNVKSFAVRHIVLIYTDLTSYNLLGRYIFYLCIAIPFLCLYFKMRLNYLILLIFSILLKPQDIIFRSFRRH